MGQPKIYPPKQLGQAGATSGQGLLWNGSQWVPAAVNATQLQGRNVAATAPTNGQALAWNSGASDWEPTTITASGAQIPYANNYQFSISAASIGSPTLTAGSNTITLTTTCPLGVNGTDSNHYLYISGGTSKSISAISKANPAVVTSTGHGLVIGSHPGVTITGATGTGWTAVNRLWYATVIDANTFSIPVDSTGFGTLGGTITFTIAESVLITGGTAVSNVLGGTLIFTCVNAHGGAFTITSATAGFQEMINVGTAASISGMFSFDPSQFYSFHAGVTWPDNGGSYTLWGQNPMSFCIQKAYDFVNGNLFDHAGNSNFNYVVYDSCGITTLSTNASGALINLRCIFKVSNCRIGGGYDDIVLNGTSGEILNCYFGSAVHACIVLQQSGGSVCNDVRICGATMFAGNASYGILALACDGLTISDINASGSANAIVFQPPNDGVSYCASITISSVFWDVPSAGGIVCIQTNGAIGGVTVTGCRFNGGPDSSHQTTQFSLYDFGSRSGSGQLYEISVVNCFAGYAQTHGFTAQNSLVSNSQISFTNCQSVGNGGDGFHGSFGGSVLMDGNISDSNTAYGFNFTNCQNVSITGGQALGNGTAGINLSSNINLVVANVHGNTDTPTTVAAASSISAVFSDLLILTAGAGTIDSITNIFAGRELCVLNNTGGSLSISAAGNVAASHTLGNLTTLYLIATDLGSGLKWY